MSVAATEQINNFDCLPEFEQRQIPDVIVVPELAQDEFLRRRAERFIRFAGHAAINQEVSPEQSHESRSTSLMDAIHRAVKGDDEALELVKANVRTDVVERTIKVGHIIEVELAVENNGKIFQHGQSMESIQSNTLNYAANIWQMRGRAEAETRNSFRIESLLRQGLLEDYVFVVFSRAENLPEAGFFTDTMSCAIQATTVHGDGLKTESAFVAGIKEPGDYQHDEQTIIKVGNSLGVNYADKTATEIIDTPLLIHKRLMPNGVVDLVKLYDDCAGGTFFGEVKPQQDYLDYKQLCKQREENYAPKVQKIMGQLLAEAQQINTPIMATQRLHKISERNMVEQATYDKSINPLVFGRPAAVFIEEARLYSELGNAELAQVASRKAKLVSNSNSCPSGLSSKREQLNGEGGDKPESTTETWDGGKKHYNSKCNSCKKIKLVVGACHICEDCVNNPSKMQKAYDEEKFNSKRSGKIKYLEDIRASKESKNINKHESASEKLEKSSKQIAA